AVETVINFSATFAPHFQQRGSSLFARCLHLVELAHLPHVIVFQSGSRERWSSSRPGRPPKRTQSVTSPENSHIMPHSVPGLMSPGIIPPTGIRGLQPQFLASPHHLPQAELLVFANCDPQNELCLMSSVGHAYGIGEHDKQRVLIFKDPADERIELLGVQLKPGLEEDIGMQFLIKIQKCHLIIADEQFRYGEESLDSNELVSFSSVAPVVGYGSVCLVWGKGHCSLWKQQMQIQLAKGLELPFMMMPHPLIPVSLPPASVTMAMSQMNHLSTIANMAAAAQVQSPPSRVETSVIKRAEDLAAIHPLIEAAACPALLHGPRALQTESPTELMAHMQANLAVVKWCGDLIPSAAFWVKKHANKIVSYFVEQFSSKCAKLSSLKLIGVAGGKSYLQVGARLGDVSHGSAISEEKVADIVPHASVLRPCMGAGNVACSAGSKSCSSVHGNHSASDSCCQQITKNMCHVTSLLEEDLPLPAVDACESSDGQGLLKVAIDNARAQEKQVQLEKTELKMELFRERELRETLEKQLAVEQKNRAIIQKRLKKEKKAKRKLQEALEFETKRREQAEQTLKQAASTDSLRVLNDSLTPEIEADRSGGRTDAERTIQDGRLYLKTTVMY
ncbi:Dachshund 1, partial [Lamprotornis superbus]